MMDSETSSFWKGSIRARTAGMEKVKVRDGIEVNWLPPVLPPPAQVPSYPQPEPRLRDRIIERIPIINRFHEPNPYG